MNPLKLKLHIFVFERTSENDVTVFEFAIQAVRMYTSSAGLFYLVAN